MIRQFTLPLIRMIFKPLWILISLLLIGMTSACAFFPESPNELTLINQNKHQFQVICPTLSAHFLTEQPTQLKPPFTLLNWNIYKQQKDSWREQLQKWAESADIITLQEAKLSPQLIDFSNKNKLFYIQNFAFKYDGYVHGVNTLSRVTATSACGTAYKEPWLRIPKTGIATTYPVQGDKQSLLVINIHAVNFTFTAAPLQEQLSPYLNLIKQHSGPIIFSGDFNTWSDARLDNVQQSLIKSGFSEALFDEDKRLTAFGLPLDHIYFRGLKVTDAQSLATESSDHSPQFVTFELID